MKEAAFLLFVLVFGILGFFGLSNLSGQICSHILCAIWVLFWIEIGLVILNAIKVLQDKAEIIQPELDKGRGEIFSSKTDPPLEIPSEGLAELLDENEH